MSYCRINDESDVYCWSSGEWFFISIDREDPSNVAFRVEGLMNLQWLLRKLNGDGNRVPREAFDRVREELAQGHPTAPKTSEA